MNELRIDVVSQVLQHLLAGEDPLLSVTSLPPGSARLGVAGEQLNVFLCSIGFAPHGQNNLPRLGARTDAAVPTLLRLRYLVTPYSSSGDELASQRLLGRALQRLDASPVLGEADIAKLVGGAAVAGGVERIAITPSADDVAQIWATLGVGEYRLSVAYEVSAGFR